MKLNLNVASRLVMVNDAQNAFPDECCGFFFGAETNDLREVTHAYPVHNAKEGDKRRRFEISPFDYMKAEQYALEHDLRLLGVYHSHPLHPAIPSEHDRVVALPGFSYIILSVQPYAVVDITSWRLNDNRQFEPEEVNAETPEPNR